MPNGRVEFLYFPKAGNTKTLSVCAAGGPVDSCFTVDQSDTGPGTPGEWTTANRWPHGRGRHDHVRHGREHCRRA